MLRKKCLAMLHFNVYFWLAIGLEDHYICLLLDSDLEPLNIKDEGPKFSENYKLQNIK